MKEEVGSKVGRRRCRRDAASRCVSTTSSLRANAMGMANAGIDRRTSMNKNVSAPSGCPVRDHKLKMETRRQYAWIGIDRHTSIKNVSVSSGCPERDHKLKMETRRQYALIGIDRHTSIKKPLCPLRALSELNACPVRANYGFALSIISVAPSMLARWTSAPVMVSSSYKPSSLLLCAQKRVIMMWPSMAAISPI